MKPGGGLLPELRADFTIIYLRGRVKREDIIDVDLLPSDDDFFDQALGDRLAVGKRKTLQIVA
jgi:hypothetical protein